MAVNARLPDLILCDLNMPRMDGMTFLRIFRARPDRRRVPMLLLTSETDRESILRARDMGVRGYLLKASFMVDELFRRIEQALASTEQQDVAAI